MKRGRITSQQVADRAGVSRTTVSLVLNGSAATRISAATRQRVMAAAAELGYVPDAAARTLVSGKTGTIGLVVSFADHIRVDAFVPQTLHSLTRICHAHGFRLRVETAEPGTLTYAYDQLAGSRHIDGLVALNPHPDDARLGHLIESRFPVVVIGNHRHPLTTSVSVDSPAAMDAITSHLIALRHRRIGFIHYRLITDLAMGGRLAGYRAALSRAGIALDPMLVLPGDYSADSGHAAMTALLAEPQRPTAVVTGNDTIAMGAIAAAAEAGLRVPHDVAVVGFDDIPLARFTVPALTTVHLPAADMATRSGELLMAMIAGDLVTPTREVFQADLVVRGSCGAEPSRRERPDGS